MLSRGNNRPVRLEDWEEMRAHRSDCGDRSFVFKACRQSSTSRQPDRHKEHFLHNTTYPFFKRLLCHKLDHCLSSELVDMLIEQQQNVTRVIPCQNLK